MIDTTHRSIMAGTRHLLLSITVWAFAGTVATARPQAVIDLPESGTDLPVTIEASLYWGNLTVRGADRDDIGITVIHTLGKADPVVVKDFSDLVTLRSVDGLVRLTGRVPAAGTFESIDLTLEVPADARISLRIEKGGEISVSKMNDLVEVNHRNGSVSLTHLRGFALVSAVNGEITASFDDVEPGRNMSFMTLNGGIDLEFPDDVAADVRLRSNRNGYVYSEFDLPGVEYPYDQMPDDSEPGRKYSSEPVSITSTINSSGAWIVATTENGPVRITKR
jgi:hypothetical protein